MKPAAMMLAGGTIAAFLAALLIESPYIAGLLAYAAVLGIFSLGLSVRSARWAMSRSGMPPSSVSAPTPPASSR